MHKLTRRLDRLEVRHQFLIAPDDTPVREPITGETAERIYDILLEAIGEEQLTELLIAQRATLSE